MPMFQKRGIIENKAGFVGLLILQSLLYTSLSAQRTDWSPSNREVVVAYNDSTIRAYILINSIDINTSDRLMYYWYEQDKLNKNTGGYAGALLDGPYSVYDLQKNLITQGDFEKGLRIGTWKYWDKKGHLRKTVEYRDGLMHGDYKLFDGKGNVIETRKFRNGREILKGDRKKAEKSRLKEEKQKERNSNKTDQETKE